MDTFCKKLKEIFNRPYGLSSLVEIRVLYLMVYVLIFSTLSNCSIQKRTYTKGWHITRTNHFNNINLSKLHDNAEICALESSLADKDKFIQDFDTLNEHPTYQNEKKLEDIPVEFDYLDCQKTKQVILRLNSKKLNKCKESIRTEQTQNWYLSRKSGKGLTKFLGGFLGFCLAVVLIPLVIMFIISSFLEMEDCLFIEDAEDGVFKKAFKKCYNTVFKAGIQFLNIVLIISAMVFVSISIFANFGLASLFLFLILTAIAFIAILLLVDEFLDWFLFMD